MKILATRYFWRNPALTTFALLTGTLLLLYWKVFSFGYYSDDVDNIPAASKSLRHLLLLPQQPDNPLPSFYYRPVAWLTFWAIQRGGLESPTCEYAINLSLHLFNAFILYLLILAVVTAERDGRTFVPLLFSLIFSLGFIPAYSVMWISQRFDLLSTSFVLLALLFAVRHWKVGYKKYLFLMGISAILAALSKEIAFSLPFLLGGLYLLMNRCVSKQSGSRQRFIQTLAIVSISLALVFLLRRIVLPHSADLSFITPHAAIPAMVRSIVELLQPFRTITLAHLVSDRSLVTNVLLVCSCAMMLIWLVLVWFGYRRMGFKAAAALVVPFVGIGIIVASLGWVNPRMLYLPYAILLLMTALPLYVRKPQRGAGIAAVVMLLLQIGVSSTVAQYFTRLHEANCWANSVPQPNSTHSYYVITQEYNRQWHQKHGGELFPVLYSEADPIFEGITNPPGSERFSIESVSDTSLQLESRIPNRFFQIRESRWTSDTQKGKRIIFFGYTVEVLETTLDGRAKKILISWTADALRSHPLYIDNGAGFRMVPAVQKTGFRYH